MTPQAIAEEARTALTARRRLALVLMGAWLAFGLVASSLIYASGLSLGRGERMAYGRAMLVSVPEWVIWALTAPVVLWLSGRFPITGRGWPKRALLHFLFADALHVASSAAIAGLYAAVLRPEEFTFQQLFLRYLSIRWQLGLVMYAVVLAADAAWGHWRAARVRELRAAQLEATLAETRLDALRRRLDPHFLFNTLQTVSSLVPVDPDAARRTLALLGDLLRTVLDEHGRAVVPLREELDFLARYLEIERTRFPGRLELSIEVDDDTRGLLVPPFVLQPLVENAIRHGVAQRAGTGRVVVEARRADSRLRLTVRDDGPGPAAEANEGIGMLTTRARLETLYGADHRLTLEPAPGGGALVTVELPASEAGRAATTEAAAHA